MNRGRRHTGMRSSAPICVLCLAFCASSAYRDAWGDDLRAPVFGPVAGNPAAPAPAGEQGDDERQRGRTTSADVGRLDAARRQVDEGGGATLVLNLLEDAEFEAVFERTASTASGFALSGKLARHPASAVTVVVNADVIAGTVWAPGSTYRITGTAERTFIRELETGLRCHLVPLPGTRPVGVDLDPANAVRQADDEDDDGEEAVIDLLVVYPPSARRLEGGHRAIRALVDHDVSATNDAYSVSGANLRLELAAAIEVDYRYQGLFRALDDLFETGTDLRDAVDELQANYGADLVYLHLGSTPRGFVGAAGVAASFYDPAPENIARLAYTVGYSSAFAHEIGHIMGLKHERADDNANMPFPYSHGYLFPDPSDPETTLCTTMGAKLPCLPRFSNPSQNYPDEEGVPLGVPGDEPSDDDDGPADAVRHLNELRHDIAAIRPGGDACSYELSPQDVDAPVAGGSYTVSVSTAPDCDWKIRGLDHAVSVTGAASGTGSAEVAFEIAPNRDWRRELGVAVAGEVVVVRQAAAREITAVCDRSAAVLSAIEQEAERRCGDIGTDELARIAELHIRRRDIALRPGDFDGLSGLAKLRITNDWRYPYEMQTIDAGRMFAGLSNLTELRLTRIDMVLEPGAFEDLVALEFLYIEDGADSFPDGVFRGLGRLHWLVLNRNGITGLSPDVFEGLTNLRRLSIRYDDALKTLEPGVFAALTRLEELNLNHNDLRTLPLGVFDGLERLEELALFDNRLSELEVGLFDGLASLELLWVGGNFLTELKPGVFRDLPRLEIINLEGNRIETLGPGVFDGLDNLRALNLQSNRLARLEEGIFERCCERLRNLFLAYNELTVLPDDIHRLRHLRFLDLGYNRLRDVAAEDFEAVIGDLRLEQRTRTRTTIPYFAAAGDPVRQSFLRVVNYFPTGGEAQITAIDDAGTRFGPLTLEIGAGGARHFNSDDLEAGNAAKGLPAGTGPGSGEWRLEIETDLDAESLAYVRTGDGFVAATHDAVSGRELAVSLFNAASEDAQISRLRVMNTGAEETTIRVTATDDGGNPGDGAVSFTLPAHGARSLGASELESGGTGLEGAFGDGEGKWRLEIESDRSVTAVNLLESPEGYVSNLTTMPEPREDGVFVLPLFPAAGGDFEGVVRVVNDADADGTVRIEASDQSSWEYDAVELEIGANKAVDLDSDDLELGNADKGLPAGTGAGQGDWRLELSSDLSLRVSAYIRTADGFLSPMHDLAPRMVPPHHRVLSPPQNLGYRVVTLNPGRNTNQIGFLRFANPGSEAVRFTYRAYDSAGGYRIPGGIPHLEPGETRVVTSAEIEEGFFDGSGGGKWQIEVHAHRPIEVMSLLRNPTGHLVNLSSGTKERREEVGGAIEDSAALPR